MVSLLCITALLPGVARADNPIVQHIYTADPAPLVYNGRVYLYTGHDEDGSTFFTMREWRVWSSADMVNWTDHGSPMSLSTFSWASSDAWAGQAVNRNGKFYWYVPVRMSNGSNAIGVGVSDSPTGPFRDALGRPLIQNAEIDPTVYIDDDGQAYLFYGNPHLWYVKLNADMISYSGSPAQIPLTTAGFGTRSGDANRPTLYEEGPWFYKRNGLYYMVFAAKCCSELIAYSTSPGPTGPWTYRGTIMPTQGSSFTNHPGVIDFNGGSYFFYHNGALPGGGGFTRSVAVEKFSYNSDGTFPTINMTTTGAPQVGTLNPYVRQEAETIAWGSGVETEPSSEGGINVGWIENGDYIKVKGVAFGPGASSFSGRVASGASGGRIELHLDSATGTLVGTCNVPGTGGWQTWTMVSCPVSGATGTHDLYLRFVGGSGSLFNVNWWQFTAGQSGGGFPSGYHRLVIGNNSLCLDVSGASMTAGAAVTQWTCNGQANQQFQFVPASNGYGRLQAQHSGYDVAVANSSTAAGVPNIVQQVPTSASNSLWQPVQQSDGSYSFRNQNSGLCLDVYGANSTLGQQLDQWQCKNGPGNNQDFTPMSSGAVATVLLNRGGSAATVSTTAGALGLGSAASYAVRDLWAHADSTSTGTISASVPGHGAAMFLVSGGGTPSPSITSAIRNTSANRCLDVNDTSQTNGTAVIIWDCHGQPNQQWRFNADGTITGVGSGRCLDLVSNGTANGTRTQIWDCTGAASQKWTRS